MKCMKVNEFGGFFWIVLFFLVEGCLCWIWFFVDVGKLGSVWFFEDKWCFFMVILMRCKLIVLGKWMDFWCYFVRILSIYLI